MQEENIFSEWYKQRFNANVEQPPLEVWDNISRELDVEEVWSKVDSKLKSIDRRRIFMRRSAYASLLLLLFFIAGVAIVKTPKRIGEKVLVADKENKTSLVAVISSDILKKSQVQREFSQSADDNLTETVVAKSSSENTSNTLFSTSRKNNLNEQNKQKLLETADQTGSNSSSVGLVEEININSAMEQILPEPIPNTLVTPVVRDFLTVRQSVISISSDSDYYSKPEDENKFHGFDLGGAFSGDNIWLLNRLTFDGLRSKSLNDTKIGFGYSYGVSAGYNFNEHFGAEVKWYINSLLGQTYHLYDEGLYVSRRIMMDVSIVNMIFKYRHQSNNSWLNTPQSKNILLGVNLQTFKKDRSKAPPVDNDDDVDVYENMSAHFAKKSCGVIVGYEYEVLAFKKIILSSAIIGNYGITNLFEGNQYVPESFNRTHAASISLNFGVKYRIK